MKDAVKKGQILGVQCLKVGRQKVLDLIEHACSSMVCAARVAIAGHSLTDCRDGAKFEFLR